MSSGVMPVIPCISALPIEEHDGRNKSAKKRAKGRVTNGSPSN
jgi:hypothetical protein